MAKFRFQLGSGTDPNEKKEEQIKLNIGVIETALASLLEGDKIDKILADSSIAAALLTALEEGGLDRVASVINQLRGTSNDEQNRGNRREQRQQTQAPADRGSTEPQPSAATPRAPRTRTRRARRGAAQRS